MKNFISAILLICLLCCAAYLSAQDTERPLSPTLDLVTVNPFTGHTSLNWTPSTSPDVAGYIIYLFLNEEGYAIDTIYQPDAATYTNVSSNASYYSESYVIAAIDSSDNVSPLSNFLSTVFITGQIDSCKHEIDLLWNAYLSDSPAVNEYLVYFSRDGSDYVIAGTTADTIFSIESFESYSEYCFYIEATLSDGSASLSNLFCRNTDLPAPPEWINANYASYNEDGSVHLSFKVDPLTEYNRYRIERSTDLASGFVDIHETNNTTGLIEYTDESPPAGIKYYRLAALNSCGEPIVYSNPASTINLNLSLEDGLLRINWNPYHLWRGGVSLYRIFRNNSGYFEEIAAVAANDTSYTDELETFMYKTSQENICYRIIAEEAYNPYFDGASSTSEVKCFEQPMNIYVPNAFTPDGNLVNDIFRPVLSFTPVRYKMIIKNRAGITLFHTDDPLEGWDGSQGSRRLPEDVYIWFIEAETPEGKIISKTGTITIILNQLA
ncbi:MAG: gliding motility-associated C-terminal domain-containing protein [Bacteroidales bacterium]|nr:gliding motility-associated C-terminal domain-containing protein [Bacteroidales bacterium]